MQNKKIMDETYLQVAYYYYKLGMTQNEIANKMHLSRQKVNRMLKECIENGIVEINIKGHDDTYISLATKLEKKYKLRDVIIVSGENEDYAELGYAANAYLQKAVRDGDIIGFSRGRAISALVNAMDSSGAKELVLTQLMGGLNDDSSGLNSDNIVLSASAKLGGTPSFFFAPILVQSKASRDILLKEPFYKTVQDTLSACAIAVVGIGNLKNESSFALKNLIFNDVLEELREKGVVGEICTHFFDENGGVIKGGFEDRIMAIGLDALKKIPVRIGIAGGMDKYLAIKGAVLGGYINVLVSNISVAKALMEE